MACGVAGGDGNACATMVGVTAGVGGRGAGLFSIIANYDGNNPHFREEKQLRQRVEKPGSG
jgi:hypothetical protein